MTASATPQQIQRSDRVLRSGVDVVAVTATVLDADGRLALGLPREAFEVYEDGEPQTITQFTNERVPVGLGVLLDMSDSMFGQRMVDARAAVEQFLFELLNPSDEFFVLAFNHYPHILTRWTSTPEDVRAALADVKPSGGTAIYDAVVGALPMIGRRTRERAALVVISDGADTASDIVGRRRPDVAPAQRRVRLRHRHRLAETAGDQHPGQRRRRSARSPARAAAGPKSCRTWTACAPPPRASPKS